MLLSACARIQSIPSSSAISRASAPRRIEFLVRSRASRRHGDVGENDCLRVGGLLAGNQGLRGP